jgi:hypothetical protein
VTATDRFNRQMRQTALLTVALLSALIFVIIVLAGADRIPDTLIVAASVIGLARLIPIINGLCRQAPPSPPHGKPDRLTARGLTSPPGALACYARCHSCLIPTATPRELPPIARARRAYAPDATAPAEWDFRWSSHARVAADSGRALASARGSSSRGHQAPETASQPADWCQPAAVCPVAFPRDSSA